MRVVLNLFLYRLLVYVPFYKDAIPSMTDGKLVALTKAVEPSTFMQKKESE